MLTVVNSRLGENRGMARVWIEGSKLDSNFKPGQRLNLHFNPEKKVAVLKVVPDGKFSVSKRTRNGRTHPLIEVKSNELRDIFGDIGVLLRIVLKNGMATIEVHGFDRNTSERVSRFNTKIQKGEPLTIGSLFSGGGIIDAAVHEGLSRAGVGCYTKFVVEQERRYLDTMIANQPELFRSDSIIIESGIEFVELRNPPRVDILVAGIPCTGSSKAGKSKNRIKAAEFHDSAGACFFHTLNFIGQCQPGIVLIENVPDYASEVSMAVIKAVLESWQYKLELAVLNGNEFGCLENRDRLCLVATSRGMSDFSFDLVKPLESKQATVSEALEEVPLDADCWRTYQYLVDKRLRDKASGKNFNRVLVEGHEPSVPTIRRLYHKAGSTDPGVIHPDGIRSRLFTPTEHARFKRVPKSLVEGVSVSTAHEILGQGVCYSVFMAVGYAIGQWALGQNADEMLSAA